MLCPVSAMVCAAGEWLRLPSEGLTVRFGSADADADAAHAVLVGAL